MMRRTVTALLGAAAALALAGPAAAQDAGAGLFFGPSFPTVEDVGDAVARTSGDVVVDFRSDPATCAAVGRCGLEGTIAWSVAGRGSMSLIELDGQDVAELGTDDTRDVAIVVRRRTGGITRTCTDARQGAPSVSGREVDENVVFGLIDLELGELGTVCPGPAPADLAPAGPTAALPADALRQGRLRVDLRGDRTFTSGGFTGTIRSTVVADVGRLAPPSGDQEDGLPTRALVSRYDVERVEGDVRVEATGPAEPLRCLTLDACQTRFSSVIAPRPARGAQVMVVASLKRGRNAALVDLGLRPGKPQEDDVTLVSGMFRDEGSATSTVVREGAAQPCTDTRKATYSGLTALGYGSTFELSFVPFSGSVARCGGPDPELAGALMDGVATLAVPRRAFGRREVVLHFAGVRRTTIDGLPVTVRPDLRVVLRRVGEPVTRRF